MPRVLISALLLCLPLLSAAQNPAAPGPGETGRPAGRSGQGRNLQAPTAEPTAPTPMVELKPSITHHSVSLPTGTLAYTATAAQIPLRNESGEVECRMFYVAYSKDGGDDRRPITFAFNGGPGSASLWLHLGALGPKRAPMPDDGTLPAPPYEAQDNPDTWLDFSDVVIIDAPGCGYSRIAKPELASKFFGVQPDIAAFTQFIRGWLTEHHRWRAPLFVAGESYGGIRGSGLSNSLWRSGIALSGFVSISGTSNYMTLDGMRGNDSTYIGFFPSMAACAFYHHKLGPRFKDAAAVVKETQQWVDSEYTAALERGDSLSIKEQDHIAAKMAEYLGISKKYCLGANLRVSERMFFREILRDERLTIGRYDGRIVGKEELGVGDRGAGDPSDEATNAAFTTTINDYLDRELEVHTTMPYLNFGNVRPWAESQGGYSETASDLRNVLARNQHFRVLYCCGYYDLACPLNATMYTVNHMGLDTETRRHISFAYYPAGHMMYIEKGSRKKLHDDVKQFEAMALTGK